MGFVVLIIGNSESNHLGAEGTFKCGFSLLVALEGDDSLTSPETGKVASLCSFVAREDSYLLRLTPLPTTHTHSGGFTRTLYMYMYICIYMCVCVYIIYVYMYKCISGLRVITLTAQV